MVVDYSQTINRFTQLDVYPLPHRDEMGGNVPKYRVFRTIHLCSTNHQIPITEEDKPYSAFEASQRLYQFRRIPFGVTNGEVSFHRIIDNIISQENLKDTNAYMVMSRCVERTRWSMMKIWTSS